MFASETLAVLVFVKFVFSLPQSPRWLAERGRYAEALDVLTQLHGKQHAEDEIEEIRTSLQQETGRWSELFAPRAPLRLDDRTPVGFVQ